MITNKDKLISQAVMGKISYPTMMMEGGLMGGYVTTWDGRPKIGIGVGGIRYNVKVGDSCFGWPEAEYLEPGVSLIEFNEKQEGLSPTRAGRTAMAFYKYCCVGNEVRVMDGEGKGATGVVVGKAGYASSPNHVFAHFSDDDLEKFTLGDKVKVKSKGMGLKIEGFEGMVFNMSPEFMESLDLELNGGVLTVPVVKEIPPFLMVSGVGGSSAEAGHFCIQSNPPQVVKEYGLDGLRIGDLVACRDILMTYGKGFQRGAITVGIIAFGASDQAGHGPGVFAIAASKKGKIKPKIDADANVAKHLGLKE